TAPARGAAQGAAEDRGPMPGPARDRRAAGGRAFTPRAGRTLATGASAKAVSIPAWRKRRRTISCAGGRTMNNRQIDFPRNRELTGNFPREKRDGNGETQQSVPA